MKCLGAFFKNDYYSGGIIDPDPNEWMFSLMIKHWNL